MYFERCTSTNETYLNGVLNSDGQFVDFRRRSSTTLYLLRCYRLSHSTLIEATGLLLLDVLLSVGVRLLRLHHWGGRWLRLILTRHSYCNTAVLLLLIRRLLLRSSLRGIRRLLLLL